jgi:hypothetical protein
LFILDFIRTILLSVAILLMVRMSRDNLEVAEDSEIVEELETFEEA